jgi:hypothetical protein
MPRIRITTPERDAFGKIKQDWPYRWVGKGTKLEPRGLNIVNVEKDAILFPGKHIAEGAARKLHKQFGIDWEIC